MGRRFPPTGEWRYDNREMDTPILLGLKTIDGNEVRFGTSAHAMPCFRCGLCCTDYLVKLSSRDIALLSRGLGISKAELMRKYAKKTPVGPVMRQNGRECVFLRREEGGASSCSVYESRPEVCRNYAPSLMRHECQEGLKRLGKDDKILLPAEIYGTGEEREGLRRAITKKQETRYKQLPITNDQDTMTKR